MRNKSIEALVRNEFKIPENEETHVKFDCSLGDKEIYLVTVYNEDKERGVVTGKKEYELTVTLKEINSEEWNI